MNSSRTKAHLALLATNMFFAINFSSIKYLTGNDLIKPFGLNLLRVLVATGLLWILFLFKPAATSIKRKDIPRFILCALTGIVINQLLFIKGLTYTYSIHGSLLMLTTPILITFIAAWLLKEKLSFQKLAGLALALSGALILILSGKSSGEAQNVFFGDMLVLVNAVSYSFYFILVKPLMKEYDSVTILRMIFLIGLLFMLPVCWSEFSEISWGAMHATAWMNIFLITVGGTFLNYIFNIYGIKVLGASMAGAYIYTQPFMATAISMIFMGEELHTYKWIAGLLIFAGLFVESRPVRGVKKAAL